MTRAYQRSVFRSLFGWLNRELRMYLLAQLVTFVLVLTLLTLPGCSIVYELFLEGQVLTGVDQSPVEGAKITIVLNQLDGVTCTTDSQGRWELKEFLDGSWFQNGKDKQPWLKSDKIKLRIDTDGKTCLVPCPRAARQKTGDTIGFVMTVLDVHLEPVVREPLPESQPLEAVKPFHLGN